MIIVLTCYSVTDALWTNCVYKPKNLASAKEDAKQGRKEENKDTQKSGSVTFLLSFW